QQAMIRAIKPGMTFAQIERIGRKLLTGRGYKRIHIKHGSFHHLGMAVHDVRRGARELREGMYITVEPGIYFTREGMGCRIEDDVLITANGCRVLSTGCPSDPDGIERLMKLEGLALPPTGAREIERKKKKL
ncbi:MAG: M24 family metallopeptidase, partial [Planctomycetota bacterium]